jgi:hypothetical protein
VKQNLNKILYSAVKESIKNKHSTLTPVLPICYPNDSQNVQRLTSSDDWTNRDFSHRDKNINYTIKSDHIRAMPGFPDKYDDMHIYLLYSTVRSKISPVHAMKVYRRRRSTASLILNLSTRWGWVVPSHLGYFIPGKEPWFPLNRNWVGARASLDIFVKNLFPLPGFKPWTI